MFYDYSIDWLYMLLNICSAHKSNAYLSVGHIVVGFSYLVLSLMVMMFMMMIIIIIVFTVFVFIIILLSLLLLLL